MDVDKNAKTSITALDGADSDTNADQKPKEKPNKVLDLPKPKKYKLLSDDDLSDDETNETPYKSGSNLLNSDNNYKNLDSADNKSRKKQMRKKKLQKLNDLKRTEMVSFKNCL